MMKKIRTLNMTLFITLLCTVAAFSQAAGVPELAPQKDDMQSDRFRFLETNVFGDFPQNPLAYSKDESFSIVERQVTKDEYAHRYGFESVVILTGVGIKITYWKKRDTYQINIVDISTGAFPNRWNVLLGNSSKEILSRFGSPFATQDGTLKYTNFKYFVYFVMQADAVGHIVLGREL